MSILIIVHKRIPLKDFKALLLQFFKQKSQSDMVKTENVEIRVVNREERDEDLLNDWSTAVSEDKDESDVRVDAK